MRREQLRRPLVACSPPFVACETFPADNSLRFRLGKLRDDRERFVKSRAGHLAGIRIHIPKHGRKRLARSTWPRHQAYLIRSQHWGDSQRSVRQASCVVSGSTLRMRILGLFTVNRLTGYTLTVMVKRLKSS